MKVTYLTGFYYKNETNTAQAGSIASNEVLHNNWKRSLTLADDVKKLTPERGKRCFPQIHWQHYLGVPGRYQKG
jgi:zinc protease